MGREAHGLGAAAGTFSFGEETSYTNRKADFTQSGFSADTHIRQRTAIWSLYANYALPIGKKLNFSASLRLQNEHNRYDVDGKKDDELSHDYHVLIPKLSMSYADDGWQHSLAFATYRYNPPYSIMSLLATHDYVLSFVDDSMEMDDGGSLLRLYQKLIPHFSNGLRRCESSRRHHYRLPQHAKDTKLRGDT